MYFAMTVISVLKNKADLVSHTFNPYKIQDRFDIKNCSFRMV